MEGNDQSQGKGENTFSHVTTINRIFKERVEKYKDRTAVEKKRNGQWESATWSEYYDRARSVGLALNALGVEKGDRVCLLSENRLEWIYTDMGVMGIGACVVPLYTTLTPEDAEFIINDSESKVLIVENTDQYNSLRHCLESCSHLKNIITIDCDRTAGPETIAFHELLARGAEVHDNNQRLFIEMSDSISPEDLATIVYTSGTTGEPKGAMISHRNIMAIIRALSSIEPQFGYDTDQTVPFLPLSHVFERVAGHWFGMYVGLTASYAENLETLLADFAEKKPTVILAVPRVCEKVYQKIISQVHESSALKQKIFYWCKNSGNRFSIYREQGKKLPPLLKLKYKIAYRLIFKKLYDAMGGRLRWMTASGAPLAPEIIRFFNAAGIMIIEGYGMTETCAPSTLSRLENYRIGTGGLPIPGCEIKIADDGEIFIRGDHCISGYWKRPAETESLYTGDGWLQSGDIGFIDRDGFLFITDRKKDIILTSNGKNIAPQKIENLFKSDPLFTQFVVIGENRKYLTALCNINPEMAENFAAKSNISFSSVSDILDNPVFLKVIDEHVEERNRHLARFETIKKYTIIKHDFSQDTGELTPSLKVRRKVIQEKYSSRIEAMYKI